MEYFKGIIEAVPQATRGFTTFAETIYKYMFTDIATLVTEEKLGEIFDAFGIAGDVFQIIIDSLLRGLLGDFTFFQVFLGGGISTFLAITIFKWLRP